MESILPHERPIVKSGVRILRPKEYMALHQSALKPGWHGCIGSQGAFNLDMLLKTGMRYVEGQRLQEHPQWFEGRFVFLPEEAVQKHKRKQLERWVRLNTPGVNAVEMALQGKTKLPSWWTWTDALRRWAKDAGMDPSGLGPKTTRKTWESWLVYYYPSHLTEILLSQGHTSATSIAHYLNMPFVPEDRIAMRSFVDGWV